MAIGFGSQAQAQAAPQTLPGYHTIVAGSGAQYTPVTLLNGPATGGAPVHGLAPGDGSSATASGVQLNGPNALVLDSLGNLYIVDSSGPVRKVDTNGNITTFAAGLNLEGGKNKNPYPCAAASAIATAKTPNIYPIYGDGCPANEAYLGGAGGIAIDPTSGDIYISESSGYRIRKISHLTYIMTTVAGTGTKGGANGDLDTCAAPATCSGTVGTVSGSRGLAVDKHGNLYIADTTNSAIRLANFSTGQLTTVVNTAEVLATAATCTTNATATTAGAAVTGAIQSLVFDNADNLYFSDATCNVVYKVAEDPATHMVDPGSTISVVLGSGLSTPSQSVFTTVPGTQVNLIPAGLQVDPLGNLYVGESTGTHVWFWDAATGNMHTVFGGSASPGSCYGQPGSGTAPYNGCDGQDSSPATTKGLPGLALDPWGNLYVADTAGFYVHKLALGTNAPAATVPSGFGNVLVHFGAGDSAGSVNLAAAPDFTFSPLSCTSNSDTTLDCPYLVTSASSSTSLYEGAVVTSGKGLSVNVPLSTQPYPTCQAATAVSKSVLNQGTPAAVTLSLQPGAACAGYEAPAVAPHSYSFTVVSNPSHGTLSGTAPNLTYTPTGGYSGRDSFTYSVTDNSTFAGATVPYDTTSSSPQSIVLETPTPLVGAVGTITLQPYSAPVATPQPVSVTYSISQNITLAGTDSNNATLSFAIATQPAHGSLSGSAPNLVYTPNSTYFGADSFTFTVNDGVSTSAPGTVAITVNPPAPTPTNPSVSVNYQTPTAVTLGATGQGTITYAVLTQPTHGTLSGTAPNLTYTPTGTYVGTDSFTYSASNAGGLATGTVSITVQPAPVIPVAQNSSAIVAFNTATPITAVAGGGNGHPLTYSVVTGPAHGTLGAFTGAVAIYTPTTGYVGQDSFTFKVTDGTSTSTAATVSITVNQAVPVANNQSVTTAFATPVAITLVATGPPTITYSVVTAPANGTLSGTAPNLTYTPGSNFAGADSFTFKANNGGDSNIATVSISVTAPPVPAANAQSVNVNYQTATAVTLTATGLGTLTYTVTIPPAHGTLSGTAPNLTYTPASGYSGSDSFSFTAKNPGGTSPAAVVSLIVLPLPPVAQAQTVTDTYNGALPITLVATGNGTLTYSVSTAPTHGNVVINGAIATYTPNANYVGADSFNFTANNGSVSNAAKVTITVLPAPPVAANQTVSGIAFNTSKAITLSAVGSAPLTYAIVTQPANGTVTLSGATATYAPATNFAGNDSFTFTATNAGGASNVATISLTVVGGFNWSTPSGGSMSATVTNGQTATYNLQIAGWTGAAGVPVSFACTGAPMICNVTPNPATLSGTTAVPVVVTINTLTTTPVPMGVFWGMGSGMNRPWLLLLNLAWLALIVPQARKRRWISRIVVAIAAIAIVASVSGCGGNIPENAFGTPAGAYTFSVTASAPGAASTSQAITLNVN
jgi:Bacterial Ig domain